MTFPGKDGQRVKLWTQDAAQQRGHGRQAEAFMDRFVDWHAEIIAREPFDILANTSWLPAGMIEQWELYWTPPRMKKVINAALEYGVALEISASYKLPKLPFLTHRQGCGREVLLRLQWPLPEHGQAGLLSADGQRTRLEAHGHVRPGARRPQSCPAA